MAEFIQVGVQGPSKTPDLLTVQDAMQQVLDIFDLALQDDPEGKEIFWRLAAVSMDSPLMVEGEAVGKTQTVDVDRIAKHQKERFGNDIRELSEGRIPQRWRSGPPAELVGGILERCANGIGKTEIVLEKDAPPIEITPQKASRAILEYERMVEVLVEIEQKIARSARSELGSVEGYLHDVGTKSNNPALWIIERVTRKKFWCRISDDLQETIAGEATLLDVWRQKRILVRGIISYTDGGSISRVQASSVTLIDPTNVSIDDIRDPDFTGGMGPSEYLDNLREENLDG